MNFDGTEIGAMRSRVTIETRGEVSDGMGGKTLSWMALRTVWAHIEPVKPNKRFFAQRLEPVITHQIVLRYQTGISTNNRITFGTRIFQIHGVTTPDEYHRWTLLQCSEGTGS